MAGIYIHIPFCKKACHYCDFHFSTLLKNKPEFLLALKKEIEVQKNYLKGEEINTIYFGGGTPSLLSELELEDIFNTLTIHYNINKNAEITLEANPDDLTDLKISELKKTPINRLSIGVQSFYNEDLILMNRAHNAIEAINAIKKVQDNGIDNITIDLIYGIPTLSHAKWENNLNTATDLKIKHLSAYCLTVEPKTALAKFIATGKIKNVDDQHSSEQFEIMLTILKKKNFNQYEISNFCKESFYSQHNSNYWLKKKYLGLGPSAHSYNGISRQWNIANNAIYIKSLQNEATHKRFAVEFLTPQQHYNEYVLTSLRTMWGIDLDYIQKQFGDPFLSYCLKEVKQSINNNYVINENNKLYLTDEGKLFADKIASDLFLVEK
ncbi:MAG: radical SAM family heme chaperone HemW [Bacteroidia bacterium]